MSNPEILNLQLGSGFRLPLIGGGNQDPVRKGLSRVSIYLNYKIQSILKLNEVNVHFYFYFEFWLLVLVSFQFLLLSLFLF